MKYNTLGETRMRLSHLSLGGAAFSNFYREFHEDKGIELLKACLERGINYIDTGPWYGTGSSEITCGKALRGIPRDSFYIGSKVGRYELDISNMFDFSAEKSHASIELSLHRLGLGYVDIIQDNGVELARLAQWFSFNQPDVTTHVMGIQELSHLNQALDVLDNGLNEQEQKICTTVQERYGCIQYTNL